MDEPRNDRPARAATQHRTHPALSHLVHRTPSRTNGTLCQRVDSSRGRIPLSEGSAAGSCRLAGGRMRLGSSGGPDEAVQGRRRAWEEKSEGEREGEGGTRRRIESARMQDVQQDECKGKERLTDVSTDGSVGELEIKRLGSASCRTRPPSPPATRI